MSSIGVDTERFAPDVAVRKVSRCDFGITDEQRLVLVVARFEPQKDIELAIRAARAMDDPRTVLLIAGDGPLRTFLEGLVRDLPGRTHIRFLGLLQDPRPAYAAADALLQTTHGPNLGTVVLEAMASGLPVVIAYRDEEERKMADDTFDGLDLGVMAGAVPESLASAMAALFDDHNRLQFLRHEVRGFVERRHARLSVYQAMVDLYVALGLRRR
jgi:glycosyltransferase involved in cell wall biosynthesis